MFVKCAERSPFKQKMTKEIKHASVRYTSTMLAELGKEAFISHVIHVFQCNSVRVYSSLLIERISFRALEVASCCRGRSIPGALHLIKHWLLSQRWLQLARMSFRLVMYVCSDLNDRSTETDLYLPQRSIKSTETNQELRNSPQPRSLL